MQTNRMHRRIRHTFRRSFVAAQSRRNTVHDRYSWAAFEIHIEMQMIDLVVQ